MISRKILALQFGVLACSLSAMPGNAESTDAKVDSKVSKKTTRSITKLKLTLNENADGKADRPDGPPRISDAELLRLAELKGKLEDSIAPKIAELHSLQRQMKLAMAKATVDRAQVLQLQNRINSINSDIATARLNFHLDVTDGMPADAKERMRKHLLFDAAFAPSGPPDMVFGGPPPPGLGLPPTCVPPGFGPPPPHFGPPPMMGIPPGLRPEGMMDPKPGRGPRGAAGAPSAASPCAPPSGPLGIPPGGPAGMPPGAPPSV